MWVYLNLSLENVRRNCTHGKCRNKAEVVSHAAGTYYLCIPCYDFLILKRKSKSTTTTTKELRNGE